MISAQKADYVRSLADAHGEISPSRVLENAQNPTSPIHDEFEWDNARAGHAYRLEQAQSIIRFVRIPVQIEREIIDAPYFVVDPNRAPKSRNYVTLTAAAKQRETAQRIFLDEVDRMIQAARRARAVASVLGLSEQFEEVCQQLGHLKTQAENAREQKRRTKRKQAPPVHAGRRSRPEARA